MDSKRQTDEVGSSWAPEEELFHEARLQAKAKRRLHRTSSRESGSQSPMDNPDDAPLSNTIPHDRKSRAGKGRGMPKKGGAGGKGAWGAAGLVYDMEQPDAKDPNYDELQQGDTVYSTVVPELNKAELEKAVPPILHEYYQHTDTREVQMLLQALNLGALKSEVWCLALGLALEGKASHREMTSRLVSDLTGKLMSQADLEQAFRKTLARLPDLTLDTPDAPQMLGQFIARAMADKALPMSFLDSYKGKVDCEHVRAALGRAAVLLSMMTGPLRLDNVWGVGGGQRPVTHLIKELTLLLKEYLVSDDLTEAAHCLRALEVPSFHHELVYQAVMMVLESTGTTASQMMVKLLKAFWDNGLIPLEQMKRGFQRVYAELEEISLDVPQAPVIMESFLELCMKENVITKALRDSCPAWGQQCC